MLEEFGLREGINEVIGITLGEWINTAPIGVVVRDKIFVRLYENHTKEFLKKSGKLYVNVVNDPIIFVKASFEDLSEEYFESLNPPILKSALSWLEFDAKLEGSIAYLEFVRGGVVKREIRAVNRGFNAIIEALVNATRYVYFKREEFKRKALEYRELVEKCGGEKEREAFELMLGYLE